MPRISSYRNALVEFANRNCHIGWACNLVCKVLQTDGNLSEADRVQILTDLQNGNAAPMTPPAHANEDTTSEIDLLSLAHKNGVNALAQSQTIKFCSQNFTMVYGLNGSGKSSYFRILNNLVSGSQRYTLRDNIYTTVTPKDVEIEYKVDGHTFSFRWDTIAAVPDPLKLVRVFDSSYASELLQPLSNGDYVFQSYTLRMYRAIYQTINYLKEKGLTLGSVETELMGLCGAGYQQTLVDTLKNQFNKEKIALGLNDLVVEMEVDNFMMAPSIYLHINNAHDPNDILSEGELKGVAIALFLAESEMQMVKNPLIIDDPVNSLDSRIIGNFVKRLAQLKNQVILFTHNFQLCELIREKRYFHIYQNSHTVFSVTTKKPSYAYCLRYETKDRTGIVREFVNSESLEALNYADSILSDTSANPDNAIPPLRKAIEAMVDEVVFRKQSPLKYRGRTSIQWASYQSMITLPPNVIQDLQDNYDKLSDGGSHLGRGAISAPLTKADLITISAYLRTLLVAYPA